MTFSELTPETISSMKETIENYLLRLGINVKVKLKSEENYNGNELVEFESTLFNTTPVIYKSIKVCGYGYIREASEDGHVFKLSLATSYRFDLFSGGENGASIGDIVFQIFNYPERDRQSARGTMVLR